MLSDPLALLAERLNEAPVDEPLLWQLHWGMDGERPRILSRLAATLVGGSRASHILVSGHYGVGKTSFLLALLKFLALHERKPLQLWLNMPLITSYTESSPVVAVIGAIVENLCGEPPVHPDGWDSGHLPKDVAGLNPIIMQALEDLWRSERACRPSCDGGDGNEPLRPTRMAGAAQAIGRVYRSKTIEQLIDRRLGWGADEFGTRPIDQLGTPLIVYLDDLDRCGLDVAESVIRLLLRFRASRGVRFLLACDRNLMERGVLDWMRKNGTHQDGHSYVTASSALEKYLDDIVRLPRLDEPVPDAVIGEPDRLAQVRLPPELVDLLGAPRTNVGETPEAILERHSAPAGRSAPYPMLAEYLLTLLLAKVREEELISQSAAPSSESVTAVRPELEAADSRAEEPRTPDPSATNPTARAEPESSSDDSSQSSDTRAQPADSARDEGAISGETGTEKINKTPVTASDATQDTARESPIERKAFLAKLTPLAEGLRQLVCLDEKRALLRIREPYRQLMATLTPRQLKAYVRARLLEGGGSRGGPAEVLLQQVFHVFWQLDRDEPQVFLFVRAAARAASTAVPSGAPAQIGAPQLALFHNQLKALTQSSTILTEQRLREAWPELHEERVLLLRLLNAIDVERGRLAAPRTSAVSDDGRSALEGGRDPEFPDWVRGYFGRLPQGATVAEQVSSFQDYALADYRNGSRNAFPIVAEYATRFLARHLPYFSQSTAVSLSNLAVLIDDQSPFEPECDALFDAAVSLSPRHGSIPLYYAEFLTKAFVDPPRRERLIPARFADEDAMLAHCATLLDEVRAEDEATRFHVATLRLRLDNARGASPEGALEGIRGLLDNSLGTLLTEARARRYESLTRFDSLLDTVIGRGPTDLARKGPILAMLWGVFERCRSSPWIAAMFLANNYVGQSRDNSREETLGLRINLHLLASVEMIPEATARVGEIWTQTLLTRAGRMTVRGTASWSRAALGLLAARVYGGGGTGYAERATAIWQRLQAPGQPDDETLIRHLDPAQRLLLENLAESPTSPEAIGSVRDAVFGDDIGAPIATADAFAEAAGWKDWPEEQARMLKLTSRYCGAGAAEVERD